MCLHPIMIKNVNYGNYSKFAYLSDTTAQYISVPCGHCSVCLQLKQQYLVQRVQMESLSNDLYFLTLTYNNETLPFIQKGDFKLNYVKLSDWQNMIKYIRKYEHIPDFKYFLVTEYGGRRHRPHIHAILSFPKVASQTLADKKSFEMLLFNIFLKYWRRNIADPVWSSKRNKFLPNFRKPLWVNLCTYKRTYKSYNYDLHYLDPWSSKKGLADVAFYASKYALKYDKWIDKLKSKLYFNLSESDFVEVWDLIRPRRLISKGFGSPSDPKVIEHINKGINLSLSDNSALYPYFINPLDGSTFPLSPYYSKKFLRVSDMLKFNKRKPLLTDYDAMVDTDSDLSIYEKLRKQHKFNSISDFLNNKHTYFDDEFNLLNNDEYRQFKESSCLDSEAPYDWQDYDFDSDTFT